MGGLMPGLIAGVAGSFANRYLGSYGQPVATLGIGWFMKNNTLTTLGGLQLGQMLGGMIGGSNGGGNGFYQS